MRASSFGEVCNQWVDLVAWFWGISDSCLSGIHFERFSGGDTTECRLGMIFLLGASLSCIVMLLSDTLVLYSF